MGNCCDEIDKQLAEFAELDETTKSTRRCSFNPESSNITIEKTSRAYIPEEVSHHFCRFRNRKNKLNTIIEDKQEDIVSSPFILKRVQYI